MKKFFISLLLIITLFPSTAFAANSYIKLERFPLFNNVLGDSFIVKGTTDFSNVSLSFLFPIEIIDKSKYFNTYTKDELEKGVVIKTSPKARDWPEGNWIVRVNYGSIFDSIIIPMHEEPIYRKIRVAEYENSALTNLNSYLCRGVNIENNVLTMTAADNLVYKVFSWNNLSPASTGNSRIFIAKYNDGYMIDAKTYIGTIDKFDFSFTLDIANNKKLKVFYWDDNMTPLS